MSDTVKSPKPDAERRTAERRRPFVVLDRADAEALMKAKGYTGPFTGHAHEGVIKRIEIPNPDGWS